MLDDTYHVLPARPRCTFHGSCSLQYNELSTGPLCIMDSITGKEQCDFQESRVGVLGVIMQVLNQANHIEQKPVQKKPLLVAFDVDMTLIDGEGRPRHHVIDLLRWFITNGDTVYVWSGGGVEYAEHWIERLGIGYLGIIPIDKFSVPVDIAIDDMADGIDITKQLNAKVIIKV